MQEYGQWEVKTGATFNEPETVVYWASQPNIPRREKQMEVALLTKKTYYTLEEVKKVHF